MPPKAKKEKSVKGAEAEQMVLDYMRMTNRPYSANDVSTNLKEKVSKTDAPKVLAALAEKGDIIGKAYGKQTIFVYNQSLLQVLSSEEMSKLDGEAAAQKEVAEERKKELRSLQNELSAKESTPHTSELSKAIDNATVSNDKLLKALSAYRGESAAPPLTVEEMSKIDKDWTVWRREWETRRKKYKEAVGILGEMNAIGKQAEFEEEQGVEVDDEEAIAVEQGEFTKPVARLAPNKNAGNLKRQRSTSASTTSSKRRTVSAGSSG